MYPTLDTISLTIWKVPSTVVPWYARVGGGTLGQPPAVSICQSWELNLNIFPSYSHHPHYQNHNFHYLGREQPLKHIYCHGQPKMAPYKEDSSALKEPWLDDGAVAVLHQPLISKHLNKLLSSFPRQNGQKYRRYPKLGGL